MFFWIPIRTEIVGDCEIVSYTSKVSVRWVVNIIDNQNPVFVQKLDAVVQVRKAPFSGVVAVQENQVEFVADCWEYDF